MDVTKSTEKLQRATDILKKKEGLQLDSLAG